MNYSRIIVGHNIADDRVIQRKIVFTAIISFLIGTEEQSISSSLVILIWLKLLS